MKKILFIFALSILPPGVLTAQNFTKKVLVEEFTGEGCVNCPRVAGYIHNSLRQDEFADNIIVVCHHSGYHDDWLTTDFDRDYTWFYNAESTFAPGVMVDRNAGSEISPVHKISSPAMLEELWREALAEPARISVNISAEQDIENKIVRVRVNGLRDTSSLEITNPVITVFLVEDEIEAIYQMGAGEDYVHQHVNRAVNSSWGEAIEFTGDSYVYDCEFSFSPFWDKDNMYVAAFVSNYNSTDPTDCRVLNTSKLLFNDFSGLSSSVPVNIYEYNEEIFTLSGLKINSQPLPPGVYIRKRGSRTDKIIIR